MYMKLNVGKVVDHMTRGSCILTDSVKSEDDDSSLVHYIGIRDYIESDKTNPDIHDWLKLCNAGLMISE